MLLIQTKSGLVFLMMLIQTKASKFYCLYDTVGQQGLCAYIIAVAVLSGGWLGQRLISTNHTRQATAQIKQQQNAISRLRNDRFP